MVQGFNWLANGKDRAAGLKCRADADTDYLVADNSTIGRGSNTTLIELIFPFAT